jgi:hypothetical protein
MELWLLGSVWNFDVPRVPASTPALKPVAGTRVRHAFTAVGSRIGDAGIELVLGHAAAADMIRLLFTGATAFLASVRAREKSRVRGDLLEQASEGGNEPARQLNFRCRSGGGSRTVLPDEREQFMIIALPL